MWPLTSTGTLQVEVPPVTDTCMDDESRGTMTEVSSEKAPSKVLSSKPVENFPYPDQYLTPSAVASTVPSVHDIMPSTDPSLGPYTSNYTSHIDPKAHTVTASSHFRVSTACIKAAIHDPDIYIRLSPYLQSYTLTSHTDTATSMTLTEIYPVILGFNGTATGTLDIEVRENGLWIKSHMNKGLRSEVISTNEITITDDAEEGEGGVRGCTVCRKVTMLKNPRFTDGFVLRKGEEPLKDMFEELGRVAAELEVKKAEDGHEKVKKEIGKLQVYRGAA